MVDTFVKNLVDRDLSKYGQGNPCPKSLTIVDAYGWRHYELGSIYGFVVYIAYDKTLGDDGWIGLASIEEDDENWFVSDCAMNMSAFWAKAVKTTYDRMVNWITEHIFEGWEEDSPLDSKHYVRKILKPIENEIVMFEGEPDNAVLGKKYVNNQVE